MIMQQKQKTNDNQKVTEFNIDYKIFTVRFSVPDIPQVILVRPFNPNPVPFLRWNLQIKVRKRNKYRTENRERIGSQKDIKGVIILSLSFFYQFPILCLSFFSFTILILSVSYPFTSPSFFYPLAISSRFSAQNTHGDMIMVQGWGPRGLNYNMRMW